MNKYKDFQLVLILAPFVFSFALGLDIYIPIVPQMTQLFDTSSAMIQLTLSLFLFTTGVGQLLIGPLSDQFGRRNVFAVSALLYSFGAVGCALSTHIFWLIIARFITSLGACGMLVTSFALIRDLFSGDKSAKMYSFLNGAIGISPMFAPVIGGYLATYFGWQSIFLFIAIIGCASLFISFRYIQETHAKENRVKINREIFKRYLLIFTHRQFIIYALIAGLAEAVFFCFFSVSPFIIIDTLSIPTHEFGYYFAFFGSVIAFGGIGSGKIIEKAGIDQTIKIGILLLMLGGASMLIWHYLFSLSLQGFLIPMVIACTGAMFVVGAGAAAALEPFGAIAGTAAAAFGALDFGIAAIVGSLLMLFPTHNTIPYGISILLMSGLSLSLFFIRKPELNPV